MTLASKNVAVPFSGACRAAFTILALAAAPLALSADEPKQSKPAPETTTLIVDPAPEPVPALKFQLLVPPEAEIAGNAAPIYERIVHERGDGWKKALGTEPSRFLEMPGDEVPLDELGEFLERFSAVSEQLSAAARRSYCDWEYVTEGQDPIKILLPDAQYMAQLCPAAGRQGALRGP